MFQLRSIRYPQRPFLFELRRATAIRKQPESPGCNRAHSKSAAIDDLEHTVFTVRPTMIFIKAGYALAVLGGIALVFLLASIGVPASISIPLALALLLIPAYYHLRRNMVRYTVTDSKLQIDTGLIARTTRNIPLEQSSGRDRLSEHSATSAGFWRHHSRQRQRNWRFNSHAQHQQPRHYADLLLRELRRWH